MRYCILNMSPEEESLYVFAFDDGCCICLLCLKMHTLLKRNCTNTLCLSMVNHIHSGFRNKQF